MRIAAQLLALLVGCLGGCWLLGRFATPPVISGVVVNWATGKPALFAAVRVDELNFSSTVARTDANGHFSFQPPSPPGVYFLYAGPPQFGNLLQATFGQKVVMYRKTGQVRNVVIPAIPATELSGHVYGAGGQPVVGCDVSAITHFLKVDPPVNIQLQGWTSLQPSDLAEADDPNTFRDVESQRTDASGAYGFHALGADRYLIFARCTQVASKRDDSRFAWEPLLYPDAHSIADAEEIKLMPGDHRMGIDFHMQRKRGYELQGRMLYSDHSAPKPWPRAIYLQDMVALRSDRAFGSTWLAHEDCRTDANAGTFECKSLLPGEYSFYFDVSAGLGDLANFPPQIAAVRYKLTPTGARHSLVVQLQNRCDRGVLSYAPYKGPAGNLDFGNICAMAADGRPAIEVRAWGRGQAGGACYYMALFRNTRLRLPKEDYTVNAFEAAFVSRGRVHMGVPSKFETVLMQHGTRIKVDVGQTVKPRLPVLRTSELIDIAIDELRKGGR